VRATWNRHKVAMVGSYASSMVEQAWAVLRNRRTYLRIVYLLLAFPLGSAYFVLIVTGLATGAGLIVIIIGVFILALTMEGWMLIARFERELAIRLLGANVTPISLPAPAGEPWRQRVVRELTDPVTWKSLAYLMVEFPFGIASFTLVVVLFTLSIAFILVPVAYVLQVAFNPQIPIQIDFGPFISRNGPPYGAPFLVALLLGVVGLVMIPASAAALSGLGWLWARFAEATLGISPSQVQLAAAQAEARTQQVRAERSEQSRRELIVNASHELRTPVASISAHVESLLKPGRQIDDEVRKYLTVVAAESDRLGSLVDDVLALARADADELHLDIRAVDVPAVVDHVCEALAPLARRERTVSLLHSAAPDLPRAMADPDRLTQVLTNLVRNALNNTPDGGIISVETLRAGEHLVITVSDTGIGIDPQDLLRVFDRFYRTDQSRARDTGGSGLGLAIVRDLLTAMGGSITAESMPGVGSVFRVSLRREAA
jgi:two-component system, OmpR family, phosphate regulon sensor histidine kinase PhoR